MLRKQLSRLLAGAWIASAFAAVASAQEPKVELEVSSAFLTRYIWNGFDRIESYGLGAGPVVQPRVSVGMQGTPLHVHVGGSFVVNDQSELHEMVYGVHVERWTAPMTRLYLGYNYYDDRVQRAAGVPGLDGHEIWGGLEIRSAIGTRTSILSRWENPAREGYDAYTVLVGTIGYGVPLVPAVGAGFGLNLDVHTSGLYTTAVKQLGVEVIGSGFTAWQVGLAVDLSAGAVAITPSAEYQVSFEDAVNDENPFWAGINMSYTF